MSSSQIDVLDLPLRTVLDRVFGQQTQRADDSEWINVRTKDWPWRHLVAAAERGEVTVSRIGRKLMMRRRDLDRWLESQRIPERAQRDVAPARTEQPSGVAHILEAHGYRKLAK
jgi:hypothetical protein